MVLLVEPKSHLLSPVTAIFVTGPLSDTEPGRERKEGREGREGVGG